MPVRFTRAFGLYTFFSVFLPGMMFLLGIVPLAIVVYAIIPWPSFDAPVIASRFVTLLGVIVFITLGLFVGFGLHSVGAWFEKQVGNVRIDPVVLGDRFANILNAGVARVGHRHRELFYEMLNGQYDAVNADLVSSFIETVNEQFPRLDLDPEAPQRIQKTENDDEIESDEADAVYTLARSKIHMDQTGRSRTLQAVFASCRSMFAAWALLWIAYTLPIGGMLLVSGHVTTNHTAVSLSLGWMRLPSSILDMVVTSRKSLYWTFGLVYTIGFVGTYGFASVARNSKRYYLKYLVSDFLLLHHENDDEDPEQRGPGRTRLRIRSNR